MNQSYPAFVSFHSLSNCFGYAKLLTAINATNDLSTVNEQFNGPLLGSFRMRSCDNPNIYCDLQLFGQLPFTNVFINSVFAEVSGFQERQEVILEKMNCKTYCSYIEVAPRTDNDYSVIAQSQASIENEFLNQIRLVSQNMIIPHFLSPGVYVQFRILNIVPATGSSVVLNNNTELHVQTVVEGSKSDEKANMAHKVSSIVQDLSTQGFLSNYVVKLEQNPMIGRVLPKKIVMSWVNDGIEKLDKNTIYVAGRDNSPYPEHGIVEVRTRAKNDNEEHIQFYYLHRTTSTNITKKNDKLNNSLSHMFDSLKLADRQHCVDGSGSLEPYMNVKMYSVPESRICTLKFCEVIIEKETLAWAEEFDMVNLLIKAIQNQLQGNPLILSVTGKELDVLLNGKTIRVKLYPSIKGLVKRWTEDTCFLLEQTAQLIFRKATESKQQATDSEVQTRRRKRKDNFEHLDHANAKPETSNNNHTENFGLLQTEEFVQIGSHSKLLSELDKICREGKQHVMILGGNGAGKTTFVRKLAHRLAYNSSATFCKVIPCSLLKGRSADVIEKLLTESFLELELKKPSCLFLDDIDVILPQIDQEQRHLAMEKVVSVFSQKLRSTGVSVVLVAQRLSTLNEGFVERVMRARPIVSRKIELAPLTKEDRRELFENYLDLAENSDVINEIVQKSDGYIFNEIEKLATSINVECAIRGSNYVELIDVEKAFDCFVAGKIGKLEDNQVLPTLDDVGGMFEQKKLLERVIVWPKKYPKLFESVGVPVSKGVLLHGPSGCGKTLLANALISNSKFSVVNVKGPELLSKYIGASEENVRLVFEKARSCAPCILFFDELDSLAPKRGHDSTGVTDRVVNQLLTELDGAEGGMKGVIIIGCTSRIDLIDEALLRPGRFDHHVYCGFPKQKERIEIMKVLTHNLRNIDVDFEELSYKTDGWSGADLQLLFTNAQFYNARLIAQDGDGLEEDDVEIDTNAIQKVFEDSIPKAKKSGVDTRIGEKVTLA